MTPALPTTTGNNCCLQHLREQLSGFHTASCRLMHEEVIKIVDTPPVTGDLAGLGVQRKGFCSPLLRQKLLGCAHTTANDAFARLADAVHATGILGDAARPSSVISAIALRIYQMDHQKSRLEKKYAVAQYNNNNEALISVQNELAGILARHNTAITEMEAYRKHLMNCLDESINAGRNNDHTHNSADGIFMPG